VDGAAEIVTLPLTAYICAASDEIHTMKCSALPTNQPNSRHNFDFLDLPLAAPKRPASRKKLVGD
jgi:hypothetical protein